MKIIFLDIDGVLDVFNLDEFLQTILEDAVLRLKRIVEETDAKIVVISNWRYGSVFYREKALRIGCYRQEIENWKILKPALDRQGLMVRDITPWEEGLETRSDEIRCYLEGHPEVDGYVILDDCFSDDYSKYDELKSKLVFVDANKGLQDEDVGQAIQILLKESAK